MDKRYQVFVSSTFTDLVDERRAVMQALLEQDCIPAGMELFVASDQSSWELIEGVIDTCDYYVVIIGARYGSLTEEGVSFTEKEYDYAVARGIPVLGFIHKDPGSIANREAERTDEGREKLAAFIEKVRQKQVKTFGSPDELAAQVGASIAREMKRRPGIGWVRGDQAMTPETEAEMSELKAQIAQLQLTSVKSGTGSDALLSDEDLADLSQGEDKFELSVGFKPIGSPVRSALDQVSTVDVTWNSVIRLLGPVLIDEASEADMIDRLAYVAAEVLNRDGGWPDQDNLEAFCDSSDLDLIKVQLRALGLIDRGSKKRAVADKSIYWRLTDRGDLLLAQLVAIRRTADPEA